MPDVLLCNSHAWSETNGIYVTCRQHMDCQKALKRGGGGGGKYVSLSLWLYLGEELVDPPVFLGAGFAQDSPHFGRELLRSGSRHNSFALHVGLDNVKTQIVGKERGLHGSINRPVNSHSGTGWTPSAVEALSKAHKSAVALMAGNSKLTRQPLQIISPQHTTAQP